MKKKSEPKMSHEMGKHSGYHTDGENYVLAPMHTQEMDAIADETEGMRMMVEALNSHLMKTSQSLASRKRRWWDSVCDDLGLDRAVNWEYGHGRVRKSKPSPARSAGAPEGDQPG